MVNNPPIVLDPSSIALPINEQSNSTTSCLNRREFLAKSATALVALASTSTLSSILAACASSTEPNVTHGTTTVNVSALTTDGSFLIDNDVKPDGTPILVIRQSGTSYISLSMYCSHEGCTVNRPSNGSILCGCHGSKFSMTGELINGPATRGLTKYTTALDAATKTLTVTY